MYENETTAWHVFAADSWQRMIFTGSTARLGPVNVDVNGSIHPVVYRHRETTEVGGPGYVNTCPFEHH